MFGINFGGLGNKNKNEKVVPKVEIKGAAGPSIAWAKFLTLFIAGTLSVESLSAATASLSPEEKKAAKEYVKNSPENVKKLEKSILEKAKSHASHEDGEQNGVKLSHKNFELGNGMAVWIEYKKDTPVSMNMRSKDEKSGTKVILADGYGGEVMDGQVDHVQLFDSNGKKTQSFGFKATDEGLVELTGITLNTEGHSSTAFYNAQHAFEKTLDAVDNPETASVE